MPRRNKCPTCEGEKDKRAVQCIPCQRKNNPNRLGTGKDWYINKQGYVVRCIDGVEYYQHRYFMEKKLKRKLTSKEHIHHKDGNKSNNEVLNLELLISNEHAKYHMTYSVAKQKSILGHQARWGYVCVQ